MEIVLERLRNNDPELTELSYQCSNPSRVAEALMQNTMVTELDLSYNRIKSFRSLGQIESPGEAWVSLGDLLRHNSTLTSLDLSSNKFGSHEFQYMGDVEREITGWYDRGLQEFVPNPHVNPDILQIDEDVRYFIDSFLLNTSLRSLRLNDNEMGLNDIRYFSQMLQLNSTLQDLDLSEMYVEADGARYLGEALQLNSALLSLNLSSCHMLDTGARHLSNALQVNTTLTYLDVSNNYLEADGIQSLADALATNSSIIELIIGNFGSNADLDARLRRNVSNAHLKDAGLSYTLYKELYLK